MSMRQPEASVWAHPITSCVRFIFRCRRGRTYEEHAHHNAEGGAAEASRGQGEGLPPRVGEKRLVHYSGVSERGREIAALLRLWAHITCSCLLVYPSHSRSYFSVLTDLARVIFFQHI